MAIFHMNISVISRGKGRSAVGASAYRSGEKITNEYDGITHDYTNKKGIGHKLVILSKNAPKAFLDRKILWNEVEKIEKSSKAQLSREVEVALPKELTRSEQIRLLKDYVQENFVKMGMCADITIHDKQDGNPHAHIMLTMRPIKENGKWGEKSKKEYILDKDGKKIYDKNKKTYKCNTIKSTNWDEKETLVKWRESWAEKTNKRLLAKNIKEKISHLSLEEQGIERIPQIHVGATAAAIEKKGKVSKRAEINREIIENNKLIEDFESQIIDAYIQIWLNELKPTSNRTKQILLVILIIEKIYEINPKYIKSSEYAKYIPIKDNQFIIPEENIKDSNFDDIYKHAIRRVHYMLGIEEKTVEKNLTKNINLYKEDIKRLIKYYIHNKDAREYSKTTEALKYNCNLKEYLKKKAPAIGYTDVDANLINSKLKNFLPEED